MNYHIQERQSDGLWERVRTGFPSALKALEVRDELRARHADRNDGRTWKQWRVVNDDGEIVEYGHTTVE